MGPENINTLLIELDILSKIEENDKLRVRNNTIEIDSFNYTRYAVRKLNGDSFERSMDYINELCNKIKNICTIFNTIEKCNNNTQIPEWIIKMNIKEFSGQPFDVNEEKVKEMYKYDAHLNTYLKNITEKMKNSIIGLSNLCNTYHYDKNKVSKIENIIDIFKIQIEENTTMISNGTASNGTAPKVSVEQKVTSGKK